MCTVTENRPQKFHLQYVTHMDGFCDYLSPPSFDLCLYCRLMLTWSDLERCVK